MHVGSGLFLLFSRSQFFVKFGIDRVTMERKRSAGDEDDDDIAVNIMQNISAVLQTSTDNFERANLIRQAAVLLFHESANSSEKAPSFVLKDALNSYANVVSSPGIGSVNNNTEQVANLLKSSNVPIDNSKWSTTIHLKEDHDQLISNKCFGEYEDCRLGEVTNRDSVQPGTSKSITREQVQPKQDISEVVPWPTRKPVTGDQSPFLKPPDTDNNSTNSPSMNSFRTARDVLVLQNLKKFGKARPSVQHEPLFSYGATKKSLGARRMAQNKFIPPIKTASDTYDGNKIHHTPSESDRLENDENIDVRLKNIDPKMIELISSEIMSKLKLVAWEDIAGLEYAKSIIQEAVVWPILRPDLFTGLRRPPRGVLLFGPPGTGKSLIGKCIASQSKSTFFSITASSLTSKWVGDGEKMVRALFAVAAVHEPSVIFIDEIDSLLSQRSESEHESSRRIKTEFLVRLDGAVTSDEERILIVGATNRPQELDEAVRRRFVRRLYIPLPELEARLQILRNLLNSVRHNLTEFEIKNVGELTNGYSGADMASLCQEASMEPIRSIPPNEILYFNKNELRDICIDDFRTALNRIRPSVSQDDLQQYIAWNEKYGSGTVR